MRKSGRKRKNKKASTASAAEAEAGKSNGSSQDQQNNQQQQQQQQQHLRAEVDLDLVIGEGVDLDKENADENVKKNAATSSKLKDDHDGKGAKGKSTKEGKYSKEKSNKESKSWKESGRMRDPVKGILCDEEKSAKAESSLSEKSTLVEASSSCCEGREEALVCETPEMGTDQADVVGNAEGESSFVNTTVRESSSLEIIDSGTGESIESLDLVLDDFGVDCGSDPVSIPVFSDDDIGNTVSIEGGQVNCGSSNIDSTNYERSIEDDRSTGADTEKLQSNDRESKTQRSNEHTAYATVGSKDNEDMETPSPCRDTCQALEKCNNEYGGTLDGDHTEIVTCESSICDAEDDSVFYDERKIVHDCFDEEEPQESQKILSVGLGEDRDRRSIKEIGQGEHACHNMGNENGRNVELDSGDLCNAEAAKMQGGADLEPSPVALERSKVNEDGSGGSSVDTQGNRGFPKVISEIKATFADGDPRNTAEVADVEQTKEKDGRFAQLGDEKNSGSLDKKNGSLAEEVPKKGMSKKRGTPENEGNNGGALLGEVSAAIEMESKDACDAPGSLRDDVQTKAKPLSADKTDRQHFERRVEPMSAAAEMRKSYADEMVKPNVCSPGDAGSNEEKMDTLESTSAKDQVDILSSQNDHKSTKVLARSMTHEALHDQLREQHEAMTRMQSHAHAQQVTANLLTTSLRTQLRRKDQELKLVRSQSEAQMSAVISHLLYLEGEMQREHKEVFEILQEKEDVIRRQKAAIADLSAKNDRLLKALKETHGYRSPDNGIVSHQSGHVVVQNGNYSIQDHGNKVILRGQKGRNGEKGSSSGHKVRFSSVKDKLRRHKSSLELYHSEPLETLFEGGSHRQYGSQENLVDEVSGGSTEDVRGTGRMVGGGGGGGVRSERCRSLVVYPTQLKEVDEAFSHDSPDSCFEDGFPSDLSHTDSRSSSTSSLVNGYPSSSASSPPYGFNELSKSRSVPQALPTVTENDGGSSASGLKTRPHSLPSVDFLAAETQGSKVNMSPSVSPSPQSSPAPAPTESNPFKSFKNVFKRRGSKKKRSVSLGQDTNKEYHEAVKQHFKKYDLT